MSRMMGAALAVCAVVGCGHATTTGSAQNDWTTPTGYASATNPRVINPDAAVHPARDRSLFARREAPTLQPQPSGSSAIDTTQPMDTLPPSETLPPPDTVPPSETLPPPDTSSRNVDELPPYVTPLRP